jgi:hypothetical protein
MTDHHHNTAERGQHAIPPPPDHFPMRSPGEASAIQPPLHFWSSGPPWSNNMERLAAPIYRKQADGTSRRYDWRVRWFLDRCEGADRAAATTAIRAVFRHPRSWERTGVRYVQTFDRTLANVVLRVVPDGQTVCGASAAGCMSWGYEADGKIVAEVEAPYLAKPDTWAGIWNMEAGGHSTFAAHDLYINHPGYTCGVMGNWQAMACSGFYPTDAEIEQCVAWLAGNAPPEVIHEHG